MTLKIDIFIGFTKNECYKLVIEWLSNDIMEKLLTFLDFNAWKHSVIVIDHVKSMTKQNLKIDSDKVLKYVINKM